MPMRGISRFSIENSLSYSTETFPRGTLLCVGKFPVSKNIMDKRGISRFSVENLFHSTEKLRRGTHLCFRNFLLSKKFLDKGGGRECHDFPSQIFCFTVPKNFVREPFSVSLISDLEKFYAQKGYVKIFCRKFFVSQYRKHRRGNVLVCDSENFRGRKSLR